MATVLPSQAPLTRFTVRHPQQLRTVRSVGPDNSTGINPSRRPGFSGVELVWPRPAAAEAARNTRSYRGLNRRRLEHGAHSRQSAPTRAEGNEACLAAAGFLAAAHDCRIDSPIMFLESILASRRGVAWRRPKCRAIPKSAASTHSTVRGWPRLLHILMQENTSPV